jgi:hypothetical protein
MRRRFDPREVEKGIVQRGVDAVAEVAAFAEDLASGKLDPKADGFNQGRLEAGLEAEPLDDDAAKTVGQSDR